jgi:hypothetical protein
MEELLAPTTLCSQRAPWVFLVCVVVVGGCGAAGPQTHVVHVQGERARAAGVVVAPHYVLTVAEAVLPLEMAVVEGHPMAGVALRQGRVRVADHAMDAVALLFGRGLREAPVRRCASPGVERGDIVQLAGYDLDESASEPPASPDSPVSVAEGRALDTERSGRGIVRVRVNRPLPATFLGGPASLRAGGGRFCVCGITVGIEQIDGECIVTVAPFSVEPNAPGD